MRTNFKRPKKLNVKDLQFSKNSKEKNWDNRFTLNKIPPYNAFDDINYLSLGLIKSKMKYEQEFIKHSTKKKKELPSINTNKKLKPFSPLKNFNEIENYKSLFQESEKSSCNSYNDKSLVKEYEAIKSIWKDIGVTEEYENYFEEILTNLNKDEIVEFLSHEKKQVSQFRNDLERLMTEIEKRENDIENIKLLNKDYIELFDDDKSEKNDLENEIYNCLKLLRLHSINTIIQFNKFRLMNYFFLTNGKIDVNNMKNGHTFFNDYLIKLKNDMDFLRNTKINELYDFREGDPFFLNLIKNNNSNKYKKHKNKNLGATKETLSMINDCLYILKQEEIFYKLNSNIKNKNPEENRIINQIESTKINNLEINTNTEVFKKNEKFDNNKESYNTSEKNDDIKENNNTY